MGSASGNGSAAMNEQPDITVIIPVWNGERRLGATLEAIAAQTWPRSRFEVIVVDNGSTDGTAAVAQGFPFVKLLSEPQPGSYRARNRALAEARGEYVLFTDGDCIPAPDWIEQAAAAAKRFPDAAVCGGHVRLFREAKGDPFSARYEELTAFNQRRNVEELGCCITANWLSRLDLMRSIGGFNQDLLSGGDIDCSRRIVAAGHKLVYVPEMIVGHPTRGSLLELIRKRRRVVGGRWGLHGADKQRTSYWTKRLLRESVGQARRVAASDIEGWAKPGVVAVIAILMLASQFELMRLAFGRPAYRS
jgi:glycosyltransferase involved in cell wall biosynthesis